MKTENLSSWVVSRLAKLELFIEESRLLVVILIFLVGFFVRFLPLIIMGFPTELPFNGGGLYYHFSETILENNFAYPRTIPYYTDNGIPFAYPPLLFLPYCHCSKIHSFIYFHSSHLSTNFYKCSYCYCILLFSKRNIPRKEAHSI